MFALKKLVGAALMPLSIVFWLLVAGVWLLWRGRRPRLARGLITAALAVLVIAGGAFPSTVVTGWFEHVEHAAEPADGVRWIVVLGGGHSHDEALPVSSRLSDHTLKRLAEGVRLWRAADDARLFLSGGTTRHPVTEAEEMRHMAVLLGVPEAAITIDPDSLDTAEQAATIAERLGDTPFLLVTSAVHIPRAVAMLESRGARPIPAATGYRSLDQPWYRWLPGSHGIERTTAAWHEVLGRVWAALRGQT